MLSNMLNNNMQVASHYLPPRAKVNCDTYLASTIVDDIFNFQDYLKCVCSLQCLHDTWQQHHYNCNNNKLQQ